MLGGDASDLTLIEASLLHKRRVCAIARRKRKSLGRFILWFDGEDTFLASTFAQLQPALGVLRRYLRPPRPALADLLSSPDASAFAAARARLRRPRDCRPASLPRRSAGGWFDSVPSRSSTRHRRRAQQSRPDPCCYPVVRRLYYRPSGPVLAARRTTTIRTI